MNEDNKETRIDWTEEVTKENCGEKLRKIRAITGMSRRDLAERLGCSIATIARIESRNENTKSEPTNAFMDTLRALCIIGHERYSNMSEEERNKVLEYSTAGGGAGGGLGAAIASVSVAGSVPGLSAAGIASGLAAIGGSLLGGLAVVAALPVAGGALGFGVARAIKKLVKANKLYTKTLDNRFEIYASKPPDAWFEKVPEGFWESIAEKISQDTCTACLKEIRDETGWSIRDLSRLTRLNESVEYLAAIEAREEPPSKSFLNKLRSFCYKMQSELDEEHEQKL
jgi:transcriptional regulator with XRE-family HTH domain